MGRGPEYSKTTSHDKESTANELRHIGNRKLLRRKSVFWISFERIRMTFA